MLRISKRMRIVCGLVLCLVLITAFVLYDVVGQSGGKFDRAQLGCGNGCHGPEDPTIIVSISGLPAEYLPSQTYPLVVSVSGGPATNRGGFNLEVTAGSLSTTDGNVQINAAQDQATHTNENQRSWNIDWTAPIAGTGDVTFYLAAMAAGDPANKDGDSWKLYSSVVSEAVVNTPPTVDLSDPDGGEDWTGGFAHRIWWNMSDVEDTDNTQLRVWINYSVNSGTSWNPIAGAQSIGGMANPNFYDWNVPNTIDSTQMRVNVTVLDTGGLSSFDTTLVDFTIDSTPPTVTSTNPTDKATGVLRTRNIEATFSEQMDQTSAQNAFEMRRVENWSIVSGTFEPWIGNTIVFNPNIVLAPNTQYQVNISTIAKDDSDPGNNIASQFTFTFLTVDDIPPEVSKVLIDNQATRTVMAGTVVTLNATIDDSATGSSNITGANYTIGPENWASSVPMAPQDSAFDSPKENVTVTINTASWPNGVYLLYVYGWDDALNHNTTSASYATLVISTDSMAPEISDVRINGAPSQTYPLSSIPTLTLTATINDTGTGNSNITGANYTIGDRSWPGIAMNAADGAFDKPTEDVTIDIVPKPRVAGTFYYYVYAWDENLNYNTTSSAYATLTIIDDLPPEVSNVLIDGQALRRVTPGTSLTLNATVDDSDTGNSNIGGANNTTGQGAWGTSVPMIPLTALDSPTEEFTQTVDTTGWNLGTYELYVYGWDIASNNNTTSQAHATLVLSSDIMPPEIRNVLIDGQVTATYNLSALPPTFNLTATIDDTNTGGSAIGGANYTTPAPMSFPGISMNPVIPPYDSPIENVIVSISTPTIPGVYNYYVHAWDNIPSYNDSAPYATLVIVDDLPPEISDVFVDGSSFKRYYLSSMPPSISLTAVLDDSLTGSSNISGANYTTPMASSWPGSPMYPTAELPPVWNDEIIEQVNSTIDIGMYPPGIYRFYIYGWDQSGNYNNSAPYATVEILDDLPPEIHGVQVDSQNSVTVQAGTVVILTATIDDSKTGGSSIMGANYTRGQGAWPGADMSPVSPPFDSSTEDVTIQVDTTGWSGVNDIYVYGWDDASPEPNYNTTSTAHATIIINTPPTLDWTGETNYLSDGLNPETGDTSTIFTFRIKYTDQDNDAPSLGDPKLHLKKGGFEIAGSPFEMTFEGGSPSSGAIYTFSITLVEGMDYAYYFTASDERGAPATPTEEIEGPDVIETEAPATPTNLTVTTSEERGELILSWSANSEEDLGGYNLYRSTTSYESSTNGSGYELIATVDAATTSYFDRNLDDGRVYYYVITAFDSLGNESPYSGEVGGRTKSAEPSASLMWLVWLILLMVIVVHLVLLLLLKRRKKAEEVEEERDSQQEKSE